MSRLPVPFICLVTDRRRLSPGASPDDALHAFELFLDEAVDSGVDVIQVRERDLGGDVLFRLVRRLVDRARHTHVRVLVNDRADVAQAAGAHGVHLRSDSPATNRVRGLSPDRIIGRSLHRDDTVDTAADYLQFGTVFPTTSKPGVMATGLSPLAALASNVSQPVIAIGGITPANASDCCRAGASGIAAITPFLPKGSNDGALGPATAVRAFRKALFDVRSHA